MLHQLDVLQQKEPPGILNYLPQGPPFQPRYRKVLAAGLRFRSHRPQSVYLERGLQSLSH